MKKHISLLSALLVATFAANADTVLLDENFNDDYTKSFPLMYDGDALEPHSSIADIFYSNAAGMTMPWWACKDSSASPDRFMASHSYYRNGGKSNDWLISVPLDINSKGFVLEFDAQCVNVRGVSYISDLALYVTESLIDVNALPTTPTHVWTDVPYGNDLDNCEGDWTHYELSLDEFAGKTVYLNFVNQNENKDILCLDNVRVWRHDPVDIALDYEPYVAGSTSSVAANVEVTLADGLSEWSMQLIKDGQCIKQWQGDNMAYGSTMTFEGDIDLVLGESTPFSFVFSAKDFPAITLNGSVTGMLFVPVHRVFYEETTSVHCGNCTVGHYTTEAMHADPELSDKILPVCVHISTLGYDPMATSSYYTKLPEYNAAPIIFLERSTAQDGLNPAVDGNYDPTNAYSFAHRIAERAAAPTHIDVQVSADWVIEGGDTTAINCHAVVRSAYTVDEVSYRIAFILTENNVWGKNNANWLQENYLSGKAYASQCGGWCKLPRIVPNVRFHDVARAISSYNGHPRSLPTTLVGGEEYTYDYKMTIPNTNFWSNGVNMAGPIHRQMCEITAIVIDDNTGLVINGVRIPMSENATKLFTAEDLLEELTGIEDITDDSDDESQAEYFDLMGRKVDNPQSGVFIRRTPQGVKKVRK